MKYKVQANRKEYIVDVKRRNVEDESFDSVKNEKYTTMDNEIADETRLEIEHLFDENNTYRIRDYFKEKPSAFLTIVPMFFAFCAFIAGMLEYVVKYEYCSYWGISNDYIRISGIMPFTLTIAFSVSFFMMCVPKVFTKDFEILALYNGVKYMYLRKLKSIHKVAKKKQNEIRHMKKIFKKLDKSIKSLDEFSENETIKQLEKENKRINRTIKSVMRHSLNRTLKSYILFFFITFMAVMLVYNTFIGIFDNQKTEIWIPLIISISGLVSTWLGSINKYKMRIVNLVNKMNVDDNPYEELTMLVEKIAFNQMDKVRNANTDIGYFLSDKRCKRLVGAFFPAAFVFILISGLFNALSLRQQDKFDIAVIDEKEYAVMMFVDEQYLLKPINISADGKVATIAYNELRIEHDSFNMQKMEFQEVKKQ